MPQHEHVQSFNGFFALLALMSPAFAQSGWKAGAAKVEITPREPIWMAGFGFRDKPSQGVRQDIYARALAFSPKPHMLGI